MSVRTSVGGVFLFFFMRCILPLLCVGAALWPLQDAYGLMPELLGQARMYLTVFYAAILLFLLWRKGVFSALVMAGLIVFNFYWMYSSFHLSANVPLGDISAPHLRVLSFNIHKHNSSPDMLSNVLLRVDADVILLIETEGEVGKKLIEQLIPYYPFHFSLKESGDPRSLALFSRYPMEAGMRRLVGHSSHKVLYADIEAHGKRIQFFGIHPLSPKNADRTLARDALLRNLATHILAQTDRDAPLIVAGDFNTAPWQNGMRDLQYVTQLINTDNFWNMTLTWPSWLPPFIGVPIDHILHNDQLCSVEKHKLPKMGSDHYPVWADMYFCGSR